MLFKQKSKLDPKIRFQNPKFRRQLQSARGYKRPKKTLPETSWQIFMAKIGLGSKISIAGTFLGFCLATYIILIPNPLFIKYIDIKGLTGADQASLQNTVSLFLNSKTPWPQKNLLMLSTQKLKDYIIKNNHKVLTVNSINKKFLNTVVVDVTPRTDAILLKAPGASYFISNDGLVTAVLDSNSTSSLPNGLAILKLEGDVSFFIGSSILDQSKVNFISQLQSRLPALLKVPVDYFKLTDLETPDLIAHMKSGFDVDLDLTTPSDETLNRLNLLFAQFSEADVKKLDYIDMRFKDRGYVCFINTPCASPTILPQASSTPTN